MQLNVELVAGRGVGLRRICHDPGSVSCSTAPEVMRVTNCAQGKKLIDMFADGLELGPVHFRRRRIGVELGRLRLNLRDRNVRHALGSLHVWAIDLEVAETSTKLDFKGDPADELIAATSVVHDVPLLTRDRRIRRSKVVPLA